jgi:hypothetical protein
MLATRARRCIGSGVHTRLRVEPECSRGEASLSATGHYSFASAHPGRRPYKTSSVRRAGAVV